MRFLLAAERLPLLTLLLLVLLREPSQDEAAHGGVLDRWIDGRTSAARR